MAMNSGESHAGLQSAILECADLSALFPTESGQAHAKAATSRSTPWELQPECSSILTRVSSLSGGLDTRNLPKTFQRKGLNLVVTT
jgi:hypothetical protein